MKVVGKKDFKIYVYPNDHPPLHCHVRFLDGSEISVDIPSVTPRYGEDLPKAVAELIVDHLEDICDAWETLNETKYQ